MFIDYKDIGDRIVQKRREIGLSQKELAELLNISNNHLSNIENGKAGPSFELFILLCKELKVSSDFIIFDYIHPSPSDALTEKIRLCTDENKIIIATGAYIGEGFDDSTLDVLFLTMPISGKTRLTQYAGRLHRKNVNKKEILIYDYVDDNFSKTRNMFLKRKKIYNNMGYEIINEQSQQILNI